LFLEVIILHETSVLNVLKINKNILIANRM